MAVHPTMMSTHVHERLAQHASPMLAFEYFVPDTDDGTHKLASRIDRMASLEPLYVDVFAPPETTSTHRALSICRHARRVAGLPTMLHVSCANTTVESIRSVLDDAVVAGVTNIVVERGVPLISSNHSYGMSPSRPQFHATPGGFRHAAELVAWVRAAFGSQFSVGVMGYPLGSGEYETIQEDEEAMRDKAAAGAHFVLAQHVYDAHNYRTYVDRLRSLGVTLPVIASVLVYQDAHTFSAINAFTGVKPTAELSEALAHGRTDITATMAAIRRATAKLCRALLESGAPALHVITLNLETAVRAVLQAMQLDGTARAHHRRLPWRPSGDEGRSREAVRPIFWAMRPASYIERTSSWLRFPSGRWSANVDEIDPLASILRPPCNSNSISIAQLHVESKRHRQRTSPVLSLVDADLESHAEAWLGSQTVGAAALPASDFVNVDGLPSAASSGSRCAFTFHPPPRSGDCDVGTALARRALWGETLHCVEDVWDVFARFIEGSVSRLPWGEGESGLRPETAMISSALATLNRSGFLTINSQPRVNAVRSDDPIVGWGGPGGYVYQKAYIECFCDADHLSALMDAAADRPCITYQAVDATGNTYSNIHTHGAQAITWGVFPGKEVVQPTVVDAESFLAWKAEAFALWLDCWGAAYDEESRARDIITDIHDNYFLVNVVDHDFVGGDIMDLFLEAISALEIQKSGQRDALIENPAVHVMLARAAGFQSGGLSGSI